MGFATEGGRSREGTEKEGQYLATNAQTVETKAPGYRRETAKHRTNCGYCVPGAGQKLDCGAPSKPQGCNTSLSTKQVITSAAATFTHSRVALLCTCAAAQTRLTMAINTCHKVQV